MKEPTIEIFLRNNEWAHIAEPPTSKGGFQSYLRELQSKAQPVQYGVIIKFNKQEFGDLLFHMIYGWQGSRGGYQGKLRKAFRAAIIERIGE